MLRMRSIQKVCLLGLTLPLSCFAATSKVTAATNASASAQPSAATTNSNQVSYMPQLYIAGYGGYAGEANILGTGDLLIPAYLTDKNTIVIYGQGRLDPFAENAWQNSTWSGSGGLLYRQIVADNAVLGAYVFGDYNQAPSGHHYWSIGPGIESLGRKWDFHLNGYFPVGKSTWEDEAWASEYGDYSYIQFQEGTNNMYDHHLAYNEEAGMGGDTEIGVKLFKMHGVLVKGYVQGYYFAMDKNDDMYGGGVKITAQPTRYLTFSVNDTYDNYQHNVLMVGMQVKITDMFNHNATAPIDENDLTNRLLDPVERNFASIGRGFTAPAERGDETYDLGSSLYTSNAVFFDDNGSGYVSPNASEYPKGTYGNPYTEEDDLYNYESVDHPGEGGMQGLFDDIRDQFYGRVYMFFAPGNYYTSVAPGNETAVGIVALPDNMNIFGRDYWYTTPTTGDNRALFTGSFQLMGDNYLDSIRLENISEGTLTSDSDVSDDSTASATMFDEGLLIDDASNIVLNNVQVGTLDATNSYITGVSIENNSSVTINNSQLYGYADEVTSLSTINATGVIASGSSTLTIGNNNTIEAVAVCEGGDLDTLDIFVVGVGSADSNLTIGNNNTISGEVSVTNTIDSASSTSIEFSSLVSGIYFTTNTPGITNTLIIGGNNQISGQSDGFNINEDNEANVTSDNSAFGLVYSNEAGSNMLVSIGSNNSIEALATGGNVSGSEVDMGTINTQAIGIFAASGVSTLNINDNNKVYADVTSGTFSQEVVADSLTVSGYAFGYGALGTAEATLNINGRYNEFSANSTEGEFDLDTPSTLSLEITAFGILSGSDTSGVNLNIGSYNTITATINESYAPITDTTATFTAIGIASISNSGEENSVVIGNNNTIKASSSTETPATTNIKKDVIGIYNSGGSNMTIGSNNEIFVESGANLADDDLSIGIFNRGVFTFEGGYNEINVSGGEVGQVMGLANDGDFAPGDEGEVHFNTGSGSGYNVFNVSMSGTSSSSSVFGVVGSQSAKFFKNNTAITTPTDLADFLINDYHTTFTHSGGDTSNSYLIDWISHGTCAWSGPGSCI